MSSEVTDINMNIEENEETDNGEDMTHKKHLELQEQSLGPLKEDLAEWIAKSLGIDITAETFMDVLDNGVYICDLATLIQSKAEECVQQGKCNDELPKVKLRCNKKAQSGSWFARDNTANFTQWCKAFGFQDDCTFESEDLVSHKSERQVIITLLELARLGYKYGLEPPGIIKIEKEIEQEQIQEDAPHEPPPTSKPPTSSRSRPLSLDEEVRKMAAKCRCSDQVHRIREGTYRVFDKVVIIRMLQNKSCGTLLKNRHLMVRVGGGWETLEHYLIKHNPILVKEHKRRNSIDFLAGDDVISGKFLYIKSKYKT